MGGSRGVTLIELVILLAVLAAVAVGAARAWSPGAARTAATEYRAALGSARLRALAGTFASIRFDADRDAFLVRDVGPDVPWCDGPVRRVLPRVRGVAVTRRLRDGIVWLPDGTGRDCSGGGVYGGRVRFEDRDAGWDVVVSSSGRLRLERVP